MTRAALSRRMLIWSAAHALVRLESYAFDYVLYPYMLCWGGAALAGAVSGEPPSPGTGYWTGFAALLLFSLLLNLLYLRLYDQSGRDWFGFEALRDVRLRRWIGTGAFVMPGARVLVFSYLSIWHNPLFATLWVRSRSSQYSMARHDWAVFALAVVVANVGWAAIVTIAVELMQAFLGRFGA